jgi:hypothetical protein
LAASRRVSRPQEQPTGCVSLHERAHKAGRRCEATHEDIFCEKVQELTGPLLVNLTWEAGPAAKAYSLWSIKPILEQQLRVERVSKWILSPKRPQGWSKNRWIAGTDINKLIDILIWKAHGQSHHTGRQLGLHSSTTNLPGGALAGRSPIADAVFQHCKDHKHAQSTDSQTMVWSITGPKVWFGAQLCPTPFLSTSIDTFLFNFLHTLDRVNCANSQS